MNNQIRKLQEISSKPTRLVIGLMSGTSGDGLDIALCEISGHGMKSRVRYLDGETLPFEENFKAKINRLHTANPQDLLTLTNLHTLIGKTFAGLVNQFLKQRKTDPQKIDLIASHGHTAFHAPHQENSEEGIRNATLQIGDGDHIAFHTGIITVSDFRQKHVAAGGEGAPLAPYGDFLLFGEDESDVCLLNIGGIANFTFLPAGPKLSGVICGDTGPGNTLMDYWISLHNPSIPYDINGEMAARGKADTDLLQKLKSHPYFRLPFPKSTGRETFHAAFLSDAITETGKKNIPPQDVMATLNNLTAETIGDAIRPLQSPAKSMKLYISGGGKHNAELVKNILTQFSETGPAIHDTMEKGIPSDMKEAILFALLANESIAGEPSLFSDNPAFLPQVALGKISLPR